MKCKLCKKQLKNGVMNTLISGPETGPPIITYLCDHCTTNENALEDLLIRIENKISKSA